MKPEAVSITGLLKERKTRSIGMMGSTSLADSLKLAVME